jgi:PAS domain S-box-containing protein
MLFDKTNDAIIIHTYEEGDNSKFIDMNVATIKLSGYSREELLMMDATDLVVGDYRTYAPLVRNALEKFGSLLFPIYVRHKNGTQIFVEVNTHLFEYEHKQYMMSIIRDMSARKEIEEKLLQSEQMLMSVINTIPQSVFWKNEESKYLGCNISFAKSVGYDRPDEIIGLTDYEMNITEEEARLFIAEDQEIMQKNQPILNKQYYISGPKGKRWILVTKMPLRNDDGDSIGVIGVFEDISDKLAADKKLKESLKEKEILLREIHHRVKNNLQIISSLLTLQSRFVTDQDILHFFKDFQQRIKSLALIHDNLYRAEDLANFRISTYIENLVQNLFRSYQTSPDRIGFSMQIADIPVSLNQAILCGLIVNEVVSNSLKYAFPDNRSGILEIKLEDQTDRVFLSIKDNGIGLPENIDTDHTPSVGLELVGLLTDQLKGKLTIIRNNGTEFQFNFPKS